MLHIVLFFFFKQKTAYEMRISDWSSDVCSSDLPEDYVPDLPLRMALYRRLNDAQDRPALDAFAAEMIDRFGPLPPETANLVQLMEIKANAKLAGLAKLEDRKSTRLNSSH